MGAAVAAAEQVSGRFSEGVELVEVALDLLTCPAVLSTLLPKHLQCLGEVG